MTGSIPAGSAIDPAPARQTGRTGPRVAVVGGGILGLSTAVRLAENGASTVLLEQSQLGAGASLRSFAWLNAKNKEPFEYHMLNVAGMAEYSLLALELGAGGWLHRVGTADWASGEAARAVVEQRVERLHSWGYPSSWLTRDELRRIEPAITLADDVERVAFYGNEGYVYVAELLSLLRLRAAELGVELLTGTGVSEIEQAAGAVVGVRTDRGERVSADAVAICAGPRTGALAATLGVELPMRAEWPGLLAVTAPLPMRMRIAVQTPEVAIRPDGGGRLLLQAAQLDDEITIATPTDPLPPSAHKTLERSVKLVPSLAEARLESATIALRPSTADGLPAVGALPGVEGAYVALAHSGVNLSPMLGRLLAREIVFGERHPCLADFRPERFTPALSGPVSRGG
ncbi:MAG: FAD-binding oxidoreductase [Ilumatobacteraceae bacterium]